MAQKTYKINEDLYFTGDLYTFTNKRGYLKEQSPKDLKDIRDFLIEHPEMCGETFVDGWKKKREK